MSTKTRVTEVHEYGAKTVQIYHTQVPTQEGQYAMSLIERFGMIAGIENGVSETGHPVLRLLDADEVVRRGFTIAKMTFAELHSRGLMLDVPDLNEVNRDYDEKQAAKDAEKTERAKTA